MEQNISSTVTATAVELPGIKGEPYKNPNDVIFVVKYAEGFTGRKPWPEGTELTTSNEVAEDFTKRGLGSVKGAETTTEVPEPAVKPEGPENVTEQPEGTELTTSNEVAEELPKKGKGKK